MLKPLTSALLKNRRQYPERIVQFGGGNFLRGFVDWVVDILNDETDFAGSIALVKATPGRYDDLDAQDCLFTTWLHGVTGDEFIERTRLISAVNRTLYPYQDYAAYLTLARQDDIRFIFSNTTESGIVFSAEDAFHDAPPATFPAKLARFLYERYLYSAGDSDKGCIIIPTELIIDNATRLRQIILDYAQLWKLESGFADWVIEHNLFCNTLVDRIIPGYPEADAERIFADLGYEDRLLVAGELYHSWIIEAPARLLEEFPIDRTRTPLNVKIVDDAAPYRTIKVRILNGAHTAMVPLGLLLGIESVREAIEHTTLGPFVQDLVFREIIPSVAAIPAAELETFARDVFDRFRNPRIHHRLLTISLNSSAKVKERLLPSLVGYFDKTGELPSRLALALAAFIRLYKGEWDGQSIPLNDDPKVLAWFREQWTQAASTETLVDAVLANTELWGRDLRELPGLTERIARDLRVIEAGRMRELL